MSSLYPLYSNVMSSVENLVPIPNESESISNDTCVVPLYDNSPPLDVLNDHFKIFSDFNDDCTSINDDSFEDIDYVVASPPDSELVSLKEVKDDILREKLLNIYLLIAKIESLNDNPTPDCVLKSPSTFPILVEDSDSFFKKSDTSLSYLDNSLPEFETFSDHTEETSSGSTTTHSDNSLPEYESFLFEIEPDQGELTSVVMGDILGEPRIHMPNVLPTYPTLMLNSNFIPSDDSIKSDLKVSFPSRTRNNIFDPGIFFEVQSKRFLTRDTFSISFIRNPLCPVIDTLLLFSSKNEDQIFNPGILSSNLLSYLGKITSDFSESPMMISRGDIPILDVPCNGYSQKDKNEANTDKTKHGNEKSVKSQSQSQRRSRIRRNLKWANPYPFNGPGFENSSFESVVFSRNRTLELESTNSGPTAKLPILKLGEYEMWVIRIKQYFQIQDYALWEVIENGDSWVSVPQTTQENGTSVTKMSIPVTAEEKTNKKNDVKARSLLLMALPNEHQLTFSQYPDAKSMFAAIKTRFGGNAATKKTQKTLLKQQYENFSATSWCSETGLALTAPKHNKLDTNTASPQVSTASPNVNAASPQVSTASVSDNTVYAFMVENPNGSNVLHQDLEQIHEDDLEAMDLKWQLSLLSVRAKKYYQRTGKKIFINANDIAGYDKSKVECYNCHKLGHFARECRAPRSKESQFRNQDNTRKQGNNEDKSSKAMLAIDGVGFDWSDMAEEQVQTNMALMAFSDSEVYTNKTCSKTCLKNYETLKKQCDDLLVKLNESKFKATTYKRGLATLEDQIITYKKNEVLFSEEIGVLKRDVACKDYEINVLKSEFEKVKQEKDGIDFKIEKFDKASKDLDHSLGNHITEQKVKKEPEFKGYGPKDSEQESNVVCDKKSDNSKENSVESLVEEQVSQDTSSFVESSPNVDKETVFPVNKKVEFTKPKNHEKPVKKSVRYAEMYRSQSPRGNQRNWNGQKSNQLGKDFVMYNKACFICGSFNHLQINCDNHQRRGIVSRNNYNRVDAKTTHPSVHRNMSPKAVLLKTGLTPLNTVRPVNTAHPKTAVHSAKSKTHFSKQAQSTAKRPFYKKTRLTNRYFHQKVNTVRPRVVNTARPYTTPVNTVRVKGGKPQHDDKEFVDSGCSRHMTGNIAYLLDFKEFDGGYVAFRKVFPQLVFGGGAYGGRITSKGTLKTDNLDFEDVYFVNKLKFNLFSVSQMCDKKNFVLFTDIECLVLSPNFREFYCPLFAKLPYMKSMLWHRRLGHINFKNINKLVKDNLVRGLPSKCFENDQTCVACLKGKQHRASCKSKVLNPITKPLFMLHMDLFGPTFVSSLMHKKYCLVVTDDYSRFTWVFFLTTKDETSEILKNFIKEIENLVDLKVKIIRSDNGTEFKNKVMDDFCREKGIKREYSVARTPQQNGVAERRNRTLIEAARTMLADFKLPTTFWAEAVSTACYVQNRVLVVKPHNKTPYELFRGFKPALSFMRPFGCHVTILNTLDSLGKFDGKSDEGFFVGYSLSSKAFRVYNTRTRRVEENLHIGFLENKPMIERNGPKWLFDIDSLTQSMNYVPVTTGTISNDSAGTSEENSQDCIVMPIWKDTSYFDSPIKDVDNGEPKTVDDAQKQIKDGPNNENTEQERFSDDSSTKDVNAAGQHVNTASTDVNTSSLKLNVVGPSVNIASPNEQDSTEE
ncbi:putative ribonuclease H-like domain-containing protein [Tanacetum coccineum]